MEDQGKRLLLAVVLAFAIMMLWSYLFPPENPDTPNEGDQAGQTQSADEDGAQEASQGPAKRKPTARKPASDAGAAGDADAGDKPRVPRRAGAPEAVEAAPERGPEQRFSFEFEQFRAEFTSYGGALASWTLLGEKYQVEKEDGTVSQLDIVQTGYDERLLPFRIGFDDLAIIPEESEWVGEKTSDTEIAFTWSYTDSDDSGAPLELFQIIKSYRILPEDNLLELTVHVENKNASDEKLALMVSMYGYQDPAVEGGSSWFAQVDSRWQASCMVGDEVELIPVGELSTPAKQRTGQVRWAGISHSYFLMAAAPQLDTDARPSCWLSAVPGQTGVMRADIVFPVFNVSAGDPRMSRTVVAYMGPKYLDKFEAITRARGTELGFAESIDFGWFGVLSRPMLWLLQLFYSLVGNWGVAIICLTVVVKLATLYWTTKSMRSMKKMAQLRPKIEALQKKYKDDKQRQQVEMMNLYKAHGVNPMAGCLPMLLQMPIWFALYRMLMAAAELYHAPFIPGWIDDLTAADPIYVLPAILVVTFFLQAKLSPTTPDSTQQKIMMYGLPLSFGVFSFFLPSGLTLYIMTNTLLTVVHHIWLNRTDPHKPEATAKAAAKAGADADSGSKHSSAAQAVADAAADAADDQGDEATAASTAVATADAARRTGKGSGKAGGKRGGKKRGSKSRRR